MTDAAIEPSSLMATPLWPTRIGRRPKGPRLSLHKYENSGRNAMWVIRDGQRTRGTGCYEADREAAEIQLARYIEANPPAPPPELPPPNTALKVQPTFVYVIGPRYRHPVKIGVSTSPKLRMASLQTSHHRSLVVLAQVPGNTLEERALHRLFKRNHINGEWFERSTEIETFIELIGRRGLPLHLAVKWITDDRADARKQHRVVAIDESNPQHQVQDA